MLRKWPCQVPVWKLRMFLFNIIASLIWLCEGWKIKLKRMDAFHCFTSSLYESLQFINNLNWQLGTYELKIKSFANKEIISGQSRQKTCIKVILCNCTLLEWSFNKESCRIPQHLPTHIQIQLLNNDWTDGNHQGEVVSSLFYMQGL